MTATPQSRSATQGMFRSRRVRDLSDPILVRALFGMTILGCISGLILFFRMFTADMAMEDRRFLTMEARSGALRADRVLLQAGTLISELAPDIATALSDDIDASQKRLLRRQLNEALAATPVLGLAVTNSNGATLMNLGRRPSKGYAHSIIRPLEKDARFLTQRLAVTADESGAVLLHRNLPMQTDLHIALQIDPDVLVAAIAPQGDTRQRINATYLTDDSGKIIAIASARGGAPRRITPPDGVWNMAPLDEAIAFPVAGSSGKTRSEAVFVSLDTAPLRLFHVAEPATFVRAIHESGRLILTMLGPGALCLILITSLIQNEWRKRDRRANTAADVVARAEIASDILDAGIVDWCVADASVVYSKGWRDLLGYDSGMTREEIYDWIERIHPDDRPRARNAYQSLLNAEVESLEHNLRICCGDGAYAPVRERAALRTNDAGRPARIILVQTPA